MSYLKLSNIAMNLSPEEICEFLVGLTQNNFSREFESQILDLWQAHQKKINSDHLNETEKNMIRDGHLINAIKHLRTRTGMFLKDAKDVCEGWKKANL